MERVWTVPAATIGVVLRRIQACGLVVGGVAVSIFFSALQGVFLASLYHYATEGAVAPRVDKGLLAGAFVQKD